MSRSLNRSRCGRGCGVCGIPAKLRVVGVLEAVAEAEVPDEVAEWYEIPDTGCVDPACTCVACRPELASRA